MNEHSLVKQVSLDNVLFWRFRRSWWRKRSY